MMQMNPGLLHLSPNIQKNNGAQFFLKWQDSIQYGSLDRHHGVVLTSFSSLRKNFLEWYKKNLQDYLELSASEVSNLLNYKREYKTTILPPKSPMHLKGIVILLLHPILACGLKHFEIENSMKVAVVSLHSSETKIQLP